MSAPQDDNRPTRTSTSGEYRMPTGGSSFPSNGYSSPSPDRPTVIRRPEPTLESVAWVYCSKGLRRGMLFQFREERTEFGRAPDCDLPMEDDYIGNRHGAFVLQDAEWKLFDFASRNGTFLNGKRLGSEIENPATLADGDTITVGDSEFRFKRL